MVSIVIPCFNSQDTLLSTLDSVAKQTYKDYEVIIIDDGSTDNTKTLVKEFFENKDIIYHYIYQENSGVASARNKGIKSAIGEYIAFLDADDMWHPQKLEILLSIMKKYNLNVLGHNYSLKKIFDTVFNSTIPQERLIKKSFWKLLLKNFAVTPSIIIKRENCLLFDEKMRYTEDHELWLRMSLVNAVYFLDLPLVTIGRTPMTKGGLSANKFKMRIGEMAMYVKLLKIDKRFIILLPFLLVFSVIKHIVRLWLK